MGIYQKMKDWYTGSNELEDPDKRETLGKLVAGLEALVIGGGVLGLAKRAGAGDKLPYFKREFIDKVYEQSLPASDYHPKARVCDIKSGIMSKHEKHYFLNRKQWIDYFYNDNEVSDKLQNIFNNPEAMKKFNDEYIKNPDKYGFKHVLMDMEGYLSFFLDKVDKIVIIDVGSDITQKILDL